VPAQHTVGEFVPHRLAYGAFGFGHDLPQAALPPSTVGCGIPVALAVVMLAPSRDSRQRDSNRTMSVPRLSLSHRRAKENAEIFGRFHEPSKGELSPLFLAARFALAGEAVRRQVVWPRGAGDAIATAAVPLVAAPPRPAPAAAAASGPRTVPPTVAAAAASIDGGRPRPRDATPSWRRVRFVPSTTKHRPAAFPNGPASALSSRRQLVI
jgi:hypothetical protein